MSIDHRFYMDTPATRQALRDVLVEAGIGFEARPDMLDRGRLPDLSLAASPATSVTILSVRDQSRRSDNGVVATLSVSFGDRRLYLDDPDTPFDFDEETTRGIIALLRAFPDADAYWEAYDAARPVLLRRAGRLVLSERLAKDGERWDAEQPSYLPLVDLPYTVEPLGPWSNIEVGERELRFRAQPNAAKVAD